MPEYQQLIRQKLQQQQQKRRRDSWVVGDDDEDAAEQVEVLANRAEAAASQAEDAIPAEGVVRSRIQKEEDQQQQQRVVVDPNVDDEEAFRAEAADRDNAHNMRQGDGRERGDHLQRQHWHCDPLRYPPPQRQP